MSSEKCFKCESNNSEYLSDNKYGVCAKYKWIIQSNVIGLGVKFEKNAHGADCALGQLVFVNRKQSAIGYVSCLAGALAAMTRSTKSGSAVPRKLTSCLTVIFLVCLETVLLSTVSNCAKTIGVYWNTTNSIFRIDNTDHIVDVNKGNLKFEFDQVNIICPQYSPGSFDEDTEKYIIYNVSKEEYDTCRITNPNPRIIAVCDKPNQPMYFTITFRPFTPQPGGLEFLAGNDYYFISTSSKDDLHRRIGGRCSTHNMKMVFKVCCAPVAPTVSHEFISGGGGSSAGVIAMLPSANVNHTTPPRLTPDMNAVTRVWGPISHTVAPPSRATLPPIPPVPPAKKGTPAESQKHPNEVVKNEELTYNDAADSAAADTAGRTRIAYSGLTILALSVLWFR